MAMKTWIPIYFRINTITPMTPTETPTSDPTIKYVTKKDTNFLTCIAAGFTSFDMSVHAGHRGAVLSIHSSLIPADRSAHVLSSRGGYGHSGWR